MLDELLPLQDSMDRLVGIEKRYQMMLYEPGSLFRYRKSWIAFLSAFRIFNSYRASKPVNKEDVKREVEKIRLNDRELADDIDKILPLIENNSEVDYLIGYMADVARWKDLDDTHGIEFFIRRLSLFLDGGTENNIQFKGLFKDFKDAKLREAILKSAAVRKLWLYPQQVAYLQRLIEMCIKAQQSKEWVGFYGKKGFWTDFNKYVNAFEAGYGNKDFANKLRKEKKTGDELPQHWGGTWQKSQIQDEYMLKRWSIVYTRVDGVAYRKFGEGVLTGLLRDLQEHIYHRQDIINPAGLELQRIFGEREKELKERAISEFSGLLEKIKKMLLDELDEDMAKLIIEATAPLSGYDIATQRLRNVTRKIDFWYIYERTMKLNSIARAHYMYVLQQLVSGGYLRDFIEFSRTGFSDTVANMALTQVGSIERFEHLNEEDFKVLEELIPIAREIIRKLSIVYGYIKSEVERKYVLKAEEIEALDLDLKGIKNKDYEFAYVKKIFNRLI